MRRRLSYVSIAFILTASATHLQAQRQQIAATGDANAYIQQLVNQVSKDNILTYIRQLESFGTRYESSAQRDSAATYIINKLNSWGYAAQSDVFSHSLADYSAIEVIDQNTVWVIGQDSRNLQNLLLHTTDGGKTWFFQPPPLLSDLNAISFVNAQTGWIAGSDGGIFKTTDGGISWRTQQSGTTSSLLDIDFASDQLGISVGYGGALLRTSDGGTTWSKTSFPGVASLRKCTVLNPRQMWVVGNAGTILYSHDSGTTWSSQNSGVASNLSSVSFLDSLHGWVAGAMATVLKTIDGGQHWLPVSLPPEARRSAESQPEICALTSSSALLVSVSQIWKTTDGGGTWQWLANLGSQKVCTLGKQSLLTYGGPAGIQRSSDGGASWLSWDQNVPRSLYTTSRNCVATIQGGITPEKEYVIVAHYDSPVGNDPGADDNASGVAVGLEVMRVLKDLKAEATIRFVATSGEEVGLLGSGHYATLARSKGEIIVLAMNIDMIGYPVTGDSTRIVLGSFERRSTFVDSILVYDRRYGIGQNINAYIDSAGTGDSYSFDVAGYETLHFSEGTSQEILQGNPYIFKPTDTSDKLNQTMLRLSTQLMVSIAAELAKPVATPQQPWTWKFPYSRWSNLRALSVVDANTIFAVGDFGTIIKTTDAGGTWKQQITPTTIVLRGVWFVNASIGVAVGDAGTILRTTDGGNTWIGQSLDPNTILYGVCFNDANSGFIVGTQGAVYQTSDGGITWVQRIITPVITIYAVSFLDKNTGFIVGELGTVFRTTNGGANWFRQVSGIEGVKAPALLGIGFADANTGMAVGEFGTMLRTTNRGANWTPQPQFTRAFFRAVQFADANNGFAVGDGGLVVTTSDGGMTWSERGSVLTSWFSDIHFIDSKRGFIVGSEGMLVRTIDGGATWTYQVGGPRIPLYGVRFVNPTTGIAVGYQGGIYRTVDGGLTWAAQPSGTTQHLRGVDFADQFTGVAVGDFGAMVRTTDGGITWTDQTIQPTAHWTMYLYGIAFGTPTNGIAVGRLDTIPGTIPFTKSLILRTTDGGKNWIRSQAPAPNNRELRGVSFGGLTTVTVVGDTGLILRSTNSGVNWFAQAGVVVDPESGIIPPPTTRLYSVSCAGPTVAIATGAFGTVVRTLDGGATWTRELTGVNYNLNGVWTPNGINAVAVGLAGIVLASNDGGATWITQSSPSTADLYAVHFLDVDRGTIVGDLGTVLRTALASVPTIVRMDNGASIPIGFDLFQNYPNPFNGSTNIEFRIPAALGGKSMIGFVSLKIYDLLGREVAKLVDEVRSPGAYRIRWDSRNLPSGVYFYCLRVGDLATTKKMVLIK